MKLKDIKDLYEKNVKVVQIDNDIIIGVFCSYERKNENENGRENITIETEEGVLICVYLDEIKTIEQDFSDQYEKGKYILSRLEELGIDVITSGDAISDENYNRSYKLLKENPRIKKETFLRIINFEEEEEHKILDKESPCYKVLMSMINKVSKIANISEPNQVLLALKLNTDVKVIKWIDWIKTKQIEENKLSVNEDDIVGAACDIDRYGYIRRD